MAERKDSRSKRGSRGRKPRSANDSADQEEAPDSPPSRPSGPSPAAPPPPISRYAEDAVNREEVAAREAGIYDEEPAESAPAPSRSSGRRGGGSRSRGRRGSRRQGDDDSRDSRREERNDPPQDRASKESDEESAPEAPRKSRRKRRPRRERTPEPQPVETDEDDDEEERVSWWDEIEDEIDDARGIDDEADEDDGDDEEEKQKVREESPPRRSSRRKRREKPRANEAAPAAPAGKSPEAAKVEEAPEEEPEPEEDDFLAGIFSEEEEQQKPAKTAESDAGVAADSGDAKKAAAAPAEPSGDDQESPAAAEPAAPAPPSATPGVSPRWVRETWAKAVRKNPERREVFGTTSGVELSPLYGPSIDLAKAFDGHVGYPGEFPFTRGVQATMYRGRPWTMRQYAGFGSAKATNERFRYLLAQGQTGLSVAFDLPTQIGYDSDDPASDGEVGKVGVPINSLRDMEVLLDGIPLDKVSLSMTINSTAAVLLLMVVAVAKKQSVPLDQVRGTIQNDMLKEFVARNTYRFSLDAHLRLVTDLFRYSSANLPKFNMISISGYHMREAGCTAVQEVAFTLANAIAYVERAVEAGLDVDAFAGRLSFFFGAHNHLFEEVAKFRAARRLWAKIMKERFGAKDPRSMMLQFHTQTCGSTLTARQPKVNVVRVAMQALASVLGGTQSLHTNSWDEALSLPSQESALLALRTQQVIASESGVTDVVDPLGGSPFVEELTDAVEAGAVEYIEKIDGLGGAAAAIRSGWMKGEIETAAYQAQKEIEAGRQVVVGVNEYTMDDEAEPDVFPVDEQQARDVLSDLAKLREERNDAKVEASLAALEISAAWGDGDLPDLILDCVESYCTIGEICRSLETVLAAEE